MYENSSLEKMVNSLMEKNKSLEEFEQGWKGIGKKLEKSELTEKDAEIWELRYKQSELKLISSYRRSWYTSEVSLRLDRIRNNFFSSIEVAKANNRKKEREISKEKWGVLSGLLNILGDIKRKLI